MQSFLSRLKERKLAQWAVAYLAGAWLLLQVLALLAQPFAWPDLVLRATAVLLAVGFLAALVLAWYHGERGAQRVSGVELLMLTGILALAAAAVSVVGSGDLPARGAPPAAGAPAEQGSIAVLPFADMSAGHDQQYFADGLTEELLNVLSQLPELRVASRTSAFAFQRSEVGIDSIARALRVAHVLEGSVQRDGDRVRITAQLINAADGYHVWSEKYDRSAGRLFDVQDEIARAIVRALELRLSPRHAGERLAKQETRDPEAHALVLRALQLSQESTRESLDQAVSLLRRAIGRDSAYARAWAVLSRMYARQEYLGFVTGAEVRSKARAAAAKARTLDPELPDAEIALAMIARDFDWDLPAAEAHFRRALELNPGLASAHEQRSYVLSQLGRDPEAIAEGERAIELDPLSGNMYGNLGTTLMFAGQLERALEAYHTARALHETPILLVNMAIAYSLLGRDAEAIAQVERLQQLAPGEQYALGYAAWVYARAGRRGDAEKYLRQLEELPRPNRYMLATVYAGLGDRERMLAALERVVAEKEAGGAELATDPVFAEYRNEPRLRALIARIGRD